MASEEIDRHTYQKRITVTSNRKLSECPSDVRALFPDDLAKRRPQSRGFAGGEPNVLTLSSSIFEPSSDALDASTCIGILTAFSKWTDATFYILSVRQAKDGPKLHAGWFKDADVNPWAATDEYVMNFPEYDFGYLMAKKAGQVRNWEQWIELKANRAEQDEKMRRVIQLKMDEERQEAKERYRRESETIKENDRKLAEKIRQDDEIRREEERRVETKKAKSFQCTIM